MYTTHLQTDDMRREALKIELSEKLNELEQKMRRAMAWKVTQPRIDNIIMYCMHNTAHMCYVWFCTTIEGVYIHTITGC